MIELRQLAIQVESFSLANLDLTIQEGEYAALMGRTGQGKTTILETICGLRQAADGRVIVRGQDVTDWPPADRQIGYVPQDRALFPTFTVREQLDFSLRLRRVGRAVMRARTDELAELLEIESLLGRQVRGLSGGEAQRVALGRALSFRPAVLILDEPLSALDESTRAAMQGLLKRVTRQTQVTTLHVTHHVAEAELLADRTYVLVDGELSEQR